MPTSPPVAPRAAEPMAKRQRHLNFTRRVRISPQWLSLELARPDAGCTEVDFLWANDCDDDTPELFDLPCGIGPERFGRAEVFIEASRQTFWQRHSVGLAEDLAEAAKSGQPIRLDFDEFDSLEGVRFRLKVTGRGPHDKSRLLGVAEHLRVTGFPQEIEGRSLLPLLGDDLGDRPYALHFDDGGPLLTVNTRLGPKELIAADPGFTAFVLPAVIGQIAARLLSDSRDLSDAELRAAGGWQSDWFGFFRDRLRIRRIAPEDTADDLAADGDFAIDADEWVESVIEAFCRLHRMTDRLLAADTWTINGENEDD